jgi:hypothetical protein
MNGPLTTVIRCVGIILVRTSQAMHRIPCDLEKNLGNAYGEQLNQIKQLRMD